MYFEMMRKIKIPCNIIFIEKDLKISPAVSSVCVGILISSLKTKEKTPQIPHIIRSYELPQ